MPNNLLQLTPGDLGLDYCFSTFQRLNVDIVSRIQATLNNATAFFWNFGAATPDPDNRAWPWLNTNNGRVYWWSTLYGLWISARPFSFGQLWVPVAGTPESDLWSMDGGDGSDPRATLPGGGANPSYVAPTAVSGAMWMVAHQLDAKFPLGAGTLPSGASAAVGTGSGHEKTTLDMTNMPYHGHGMPAPIAPATSVPIGTFLAGSEWRSNDTPTLKFGQFKYEGGDPANSNATAPFDNMPPYWSIYWVVQTSRTYYVING